MAKYNKETADNIQGIINAKSKYHAAYDEGDQEGMDAAKNEATKFYDNLVGTGRYDVAKDLHGMGYDEAIKYMDAYEASAPVRDNRAMATENIAQATDAVRDKSEFGKTAENMWIQGYQNQENRINEDPMSTESAQAIMDRYRELGENANDREVADGRARNDGNLDSFAKAQGDAQRVAYENAGIDSVFDLHERKMQYGGQNYRDMLGGISVVGDEKSEAITGANATATTASDIENSNKLTDVSVQGQEGAITGKIPTELEENMGTTPTEDARRFNENVELSREGNELVEKELDNNNALSWAELEQNANMYAAQLEAAGLPELAAQVREGGAQIRGKYGSKETGGGENNADVFAELDGLWASSDGDIDTFMAMAGDQNIKEEDYEAFLQSKIN